MIPDNKSQHTQDEITPDRINEYLDSLTVDELQRIGLSIIDRLESRSRVLGRTERGVEFLPAQLDTRKTKSHAAYLRRTRPRMGGAIEAAIRRHGSTVGTVYMSLFTWGYIWMGNDAQALEGKLIFGIRMELTPPDESAMLYGWPVVIDETMPDYRAELRIGDDRIVVVI